jgi:hypothetical protein
LVFLLVFLRSARQLLVAACVVPSSPIFATLMNEAPGSSETSVLTRATQRNNPEDTILHNLHYLGKVSLEMNLNYWPTISVQLFWHSEGQITILLQAECNFM